MGIRISCTIGVLDTWAYYAYAIYYTTCEFTPEEKMTPDQSYKIPLFADCKHGSIKLQTGECQECGLILTPDTVTYRPYTYAEFSSVMLTERIIWFRNSISTDSERYIISVFNTKGVYAGGKFLTYVEFFQGCRYLDGRPCGMRVIRDSTV